MAVEQLQSSMIACHQCDTLFNSPKIVDGQEAICTCCGTTLFVRKKNHINRTIAVSSAGLLFFPPAMILPIIGVGVSSAGIYNDASLIDCITLMINSGYYIIAFAVFIFTLAVPLVRLSAALYISICIKYNWLKPSLFTFFRSYHMLDTWSMIHVFFMGLIVSMYKLTSLAELSVDQGLVSLVLLLLCSTLVSITMDPHSIWDKLESEFG
ncbi:paraquat-inducible protein A [Thalassotalea psychrophila]|uniref:Paraquat-inducible protein A n=1 Tax=Thalassotalea psychrophila TaxID=3065647 RepID=A0ABY9U013_9GAMM|nr:paraquat-inducible protein A [Colwelliaceae bacterium SQ149]